MKLLKVVGEDDIVDSWKGHRRGEGGPTGFASYPGEKGRADGGVDADYTKLSSSFAFSEVGKNCAHETIISGKDTLSTFRFMAGGKRYF